MRAIRKTVDGKVLADRFLGIVEVPSELRGQQVEVILLPAVSGDPVGEADAEAARALGGSLHR